MMNDNSENKDVNRLDDGVGALIRLVQQRPAIPEERRFRVKAAVLAHWQREVERRSARRRIGILGGLAAAGAEIETDDLARAAVRLSSGRMIRIDRATRLRIVSDNDVVLERGALYVDCGASPKAGDPIVLRTPFAVLREIGTQFEVRLEQDALRVRVREGSIGGEHGHSGPFVVEAGTEARLDSSGHVEQKSIAPYGQDWAWIGDVTPMMNIEGRSASEFLDWVARERGMRLEFADPVLARSASETILNGSLEGLSIEQSLDAVLPTCGMSHRAEGSLLIIGASPKSSPVE